MEEADKKRLQTAWAKLVQNISDMESIIDRLHSENILTKPLKEKVNSKVGSDKLRELLDILPKRGPKAFEIFYNILVDLGEDYAADLIWPERAEERQKAASHNPSKASGALQGGQNPAPQPPPIEEDVLPDNWPERSIHDPLRVEVKPVIDDKYHMMTLFDRARNGSKSMYDNHKPKRGVFLLINNENFKPARHNNVDLSDREGTGKDLIALQRLFDQLHFRVQVKSNQTAPEMKELFSKVDSLAEATDNCFACAVLTHGESGEVYGVDGSRVSLEDLKGALIQNSEFLVGKPKLFFIQACQGQMKDKATHVVGGEEAGKGEPAPAPSQPPANTKDGGDFNFEALADKFAGLDTKETTDAVSEGPVSPRSDIFVAMATVAGFVSWRNTEWGTWFAQAIAYIFSNYANKYEINKLMNMVKRLVGEAKTSGGFKQVSTCSSSLVRDFYFFPGLTFSPDHITSQSQVDHNPSNSLTFTSTGPTNRLTTSVQPSTESGGGLSQPSDDLGKGSRKGVQLE